MHDHLTIGEVDRDGAIEEAAAAVAGDTRATVLKKAAVGGGALLGIGALVGQPEFASAARSKKQDIAILNYALTLEYLEAAFYTEAELKGALSGPTRTFADVVGKHERDHVLLLRSVLGSKAVKKPTFDFKGTTADMTKFQQTAKVLEDTGVSAYTGQTNRIQQALILVTAAKILSVEARHAAWIADIIGVTPAPSSLGRSATMSQVLTAVKKTGFITG